MKKKTNQNIFLHSSKTGGTEDTKDFFFKVGSFKWPHEK
jgi:hypothetical protein